MERVRIARDTARAWVEAFNARRFGEARSAREIAAKIITRVERGGDPAISAILEEIDGVEMKPAELLVKPADGRIEVELRRAVETSIERVSAYHELQRSSTLTRRHGDLELQTMPLERVGIYVPGGAAVYLSTLIMCAVPARIAGVPEIVVATTPRVARMPEFLWACQRLGVREVVRAGGAAGIAALAIGTESIRRVQKIVGPGNAYVNEAKKLLRDRVGIDLPAGPSEIVVVADAAADSEIVAADMLAQAEHGTDAVAICITSSEDFAEALEARINQRMGRSAEAARPAIEASGAILLVDDLVEATSLANEIAPEHLSIQVQDPEPLVERTRNCAAIFVGPHSAVALGDYVAGSNHVLPTGGTARFCSSLGVSDFMTRRSIVRISDATLDEIGPAAITIAEYEGLTLHAESVRVRTAARRRGIDVRAYGSPVREGRRVRSGTDFIPEAIRGMSAYTLEPRTARDKLDQNESAFDVPESIKRRVLERMAARRWSEYPDFEAVRIRDAIAKRTGVERENVLVGNGSNELLMVTMATLVREGTRVVLPVPTFPLYEKFATIFGGSVQRVPVDPRAGTLPAAGMVAAIEASDQPSVAVVCSPNNPTGGVLENGDLERLLDSGAFVVLDRAYGEFFDDGPPTPHDRLVVLSTFSKAWGLASLRVGWLLSTPEMCREIRKVKLPYNLNAFSEEAAVQLLEEGDVLEDRVREAIAEREKLKQSVEKISGVEVFPSRSNFLTFRLAGDVDAVFEGLLSRSILVRNVSHYPGLANCLRVSIGTREQNDRFVETLTAMQSIDAL